MTSLDGQVAVVTGASKGIGRAIATAFAQSGARLVLVARTEELLLELEAELLNDAPAMRLVVGDVREPRTADRAIRAAVEGFDRLDVLVNNAGVVIHHPIAELSLTDYETVMNTNMTGTFLFSRAAVPVFQRQGRGTIINVGSGAGVRGVAKEAAYCASKFAQRGFTLALDQELRPKNIRVSIILAGNVDTSLDKRNDRPTSISESRALLTVNDIANAALYLATRTSDAHVVELTVRAMNDIV